MDYSQTNPTVEILIMLSVAFLLGYALRYFWEKLYEEDEYDHYRDSYDRVNAQNVEVNHEKELPVSAPAEAPAKEDLKIIEGIGPKIEELLNNGGIESYHQLANTPTDELSEILKEGGERFKLHDPSTWPAQAELAYYGKWDELTEYQDFLSGGKELK